MKTKFTLTCLALLISMTSYISCTGDDYIEYDGEVVVLRDTVLVKIDSLVKEKRNITRLKLKLVIQLAAFKEINHANSFASVAKENLKTDVDIKQIGDVYLVTVGSFSDGTKAEDYLMFVKARGYDNAFIKNLE
jgi:hypothetical protein